MEIDQNTAQVEVSGTHFDKDAAMRELLEFLSVDMPGDAGKLLSVLKDADSEEREAFLADIDRLMEILPRLTEPAQVAAETSARAKTDSAFLAECAALKKELEGIIGFEDLFAKASRKEEISELQMRVNSLRRMLIEQQGVEDQETLRVTAETEEQLHIDRMRLERGRQARRGELADLRASEIVEPAARAKGAAGEYEALLSVSRQRSPEGLQRARAKAKRRLKDELKEAQNHLDSQMAVLKYVTGAAQVLSGVASATGLYMLASDSSVHGSEWAALGLAVGGATVLNGSMFFIQRSFQENFANSEGAKPEISSLWKVPVLGTVYVALTFSSTFSNAGGLTYGAASDLVVRDSWSDNDVLATGFLNEVKDANLKGGQSKASQTLTATRDQMDEFFMEVTGDRVVNGKVSPFGFGPQAKVEMAEMRDMNADNVEQFKTDGQCGAILQLQNLQDDFLTRLDGVRAANPQHIGGLMPITSFTETYSQDFSEDLKVCVEATGMEVEYEYDANGEIVGVDMPLSTLDESIDNLDTTLKRLRNRVESGQVDRPDELNPHVKSLNREMELIAQEMGLTAPTLAEMEAPTFEGIKYLIKNLKQTAEDVKDVFDDPEDLDDSRWKNPIVAHVLVALSFLVDEVGMLLLPFLAAARNRLRRKEDELKSLDRS